MFLYRKGEKNNPIVKIILREVKKYLLYIYIHCINIIYNVYNIYCEMCTRLVDKG